MPPTEDPTTLTESPTAHKVDIAPMAILLGTVFIAMMGVGFVVPFLPVYARDLGASGFQLGMMVAAFSLSMGIVQPLAGSFSDRHGRKLFMAAGLAIFSLCGFGYSLANSILDLTVIRLIQGIGAGMIFPVAMAYVGDRAPPEHEGRYMGMFNVALMGGIAAGPLLGGALNDIYGIDAAFYGMGALSALALLLALAILPESQSRQGEEERAPLHTVFRTILADRVMRGVLLVRLSVMLAMVPSFVFLPVIMTEEIGTSATKIGIVITARTLVSASLQLPFGWVADRYNRVVITVVSVLGMAVLVSWLGLSSEMWHVLLLFTLMGVTEAAFLPTTSAMAMEGGRSFGMGSAMGVINSALTVGMFSGSMLSGLLVDSVGLTLAFIIMGTIVGSTGIIAGVMMAKPAPPALEPVPAGTVAEPGGERVRSLSNPRD